MRLRQLQNQDGLTIVEVLISSLVFMIGFSLLVAMINSTLLRFSTAETTRAQSVAESYMAETVGLIDTFSLDTLITGNGWRLQLTRNTDITDGLAKVHVRVRKPPTGKELVYLYHEIVLPEQQ